MQQKQISVKYKIIRSLVKLFSPKFRVEGYENLPEEAAVIVGNHSQMLGPIASELYYPRKGVTWCAGEMMDKKTVPAYAFQDFWSHKPKYTHPFYRLLSRIIAPVSQLIFTNARCIGVYHDTRILSTFKETVSALQDGQDVVIFPEHNLPQNNILYEFQDKFIDVAKLFYRRTGKRLSFVPLYIAPRLKTMYFCPPIEFDPEAPIEEERLRICRYLCDTITKKAVSLPRHTVVPYRNIRRRDWPKNT